MDPRSPQRQKGAATRQLLLLLPLLLLVLAVAAGLTGSGDRVPSARAMTLSSAGPSSQGLAARAVGYLERAQNRDGGFGTAPGQSSAPLFSGWAALGLASAGVRVSGLRAAPGRPTLLMYLRRDDGARDPGSLERTILVLDAAGDRAGARALVPALVRGFSRRATRAGRGSAVGGLVNLTAFGVLALRGAGVASTRGLQARALRWLAGEANRDGGYAYDGRPPTRRGGGGQSDADDTGGALEALGRGGGAALTRARRRAVAYLRADQDRDGGFPAGPGAGSNAQSTAWVIQGLIAAGVTPGSLRRDGHTPLGYLDSLVGPRGAVAYARGESVTPVWVTGEALMALTGTPLPLTGAPPSLVRTPLAPARTACSRLLCSPTTHMPASPALPAAANRGRAATRLRSLPVVRERTASARSDR